MSNATHTQLSQAFIILLATAATTCIDAPAIAEEQDSAELIRAPLTGRVYDHTGAPVPGARVAVADADRGMIVYSSVQRGKLSLTSYYGRIPNAHRIDRNSFQNYATATCDDAGRFEIFGIRAGRYNLVAAHAECGAAVVTDIDLPVQGQHINVDLMAPTFIEIHIRGIDIGYDMGQMQAIPNYGMLRYEGHALDTVDDSYAVLINARIPLHEAKGGIRVGPLAIAGDWSFGVRTLAAPMNRLHIPLNVSRGQTSIIVHDADSGARVSGSVLNSLGEGLADVVLSFDSLATGIVIGAKTDNSGRYSIGGLRPGPIHIEGERRAPVDDLGTSIFDVQFEREETIFEPDEEIDLDILLTDDACDVQPDVEVLQDITDWFDSSPTPERIDELVNMLIDCVHHDAAATKLRGLGIDALDHLIAGYQRTFDDEARVLIQQLAEYAFFTDRVPDHGGFLGIRWYPGARAPYNSAIIDSSVGATIERIIAGTAAEFSGLQRGDRILAVNGEVIRADSNRRLPEIVRSHAPGDVVTFCIDRGGEELYFDIELGHRPPQLALHWRPPADLIPMHNEAYDAFPDWWQEHFGAELDESALQYERHELTE